MSTVCDRFGKRVGQHGREIEFNNVDLEEEGGLLVVPKNGVRGGEGMSKRGKSKLLHSEVEGEGERRASLWIIDR